MTSEFNRFFAAKPNETNVSQIKRLRDFIDQYPNEDIRPQMRNLQKDYHYFRAIKGDGNCFYRAIMFLYLLQANLGNFNELFPPCPIFNCYDLPFYNDDHYSSRDLLQYIWITYLKKMQKDSSHQRQVKLQRIFNSSVMFDAVLIAYFRSLNHQYIKTNKQKFEAYLQGGIDSQLKKVLTFGEQSQGVQIFSLSQLLNCTITIMMTHQTTVKQVKYMDKGRFNFVLFYRPGHYDILVVQNQFKKNPSISKIKFLNNLSQASTSSFPKQRQSEIIRVSRPDQLTLIRNTCDKTCQQLKNYKDFNKKKQQKSSSIVSHIKDNSYYTYESKTHQQKTNLFRVSNKPQSIRNSQNNSQIKESSKLKSSILTESKKISVPNVSNVRKIGQIGFFVLIIILLLIGLLY